MFGVPLAARHRKEVTAVHVNRPREALDGIETEWMMSRPSGAASRSLKALAAAASMRPGAAVGRRQKMLSSRPV